MREWWHFYQPATHTCSIRPFSAICIHRRKRKSLKLLLFGWEIRHHILMSWHESTTMTHIKKQPNLCSNKICVPNKLLLYSSRGWIYFGLCVPHHGTSSTVINTKLIHSNVARYVIGRVVWEYHKAKLPMRRLQRQTFQSFTARLSNSVRNPPSALAFSFAVVNFESPGRIGGESERQEGRLDKGVMGWAARRMQKLTSKQMQ